MNDLIYLEHQLRSALSNLDGVVQSPRHHPEGDALYHSLQVFECALEGCEDPELHVAALLHDIGKAVDAEGHASIGAQMLDGLLSERIVWLVRHHMDLLHRPRRTRVRLRGSEELADLELLRTFDVAGRDPNAITLSVDEAIALVLDYYEDGRIGPDDDALGARSDEMQGEQG